MIEEIEMRTEEQESSILDELLEDAPEVPETVSEIDLTSLFTNQEEALQFFNQLPMHIMNLWANNDKVIHIITPIGASKAVKTVVDTSNVPGLPNDLIQVYEALRETIQYSEHPEEKNIRVITLKQAINSQELLSVHSWANDNQIEIYDALKKRNLLVQPTMEELRILLLIDTLLEIREAASSRVILPGMPSGRLPSKVR